MDSFHFNDPYLGQLSEQQASVLKERLFRWGLTDSEFLSRLDYWFSQFEDDDKDLAFKLVTVIDYFPHGRFLNRLKGLRQTVFRRLRKVGLENAPIIVAIPEESGDSGHRHAYDLSKAWSIPIEQIFQASRLPKLALSDAILVLFNDTHGSGKQFLRELWTPFIKTLSPKPRLIFILAVTIAQAALDRFHAYLPNVITLPAKPTRGAKTLFSREEFQRLYELGKEIYPRYPIGYGDTALASAYYFQCPNNSLPIIWADPQNKHIRGHARSWSALFPYIPKIKADTDVMRQITRGKGRSVYIYIDEADRQEKHRQITIAGDLLMKQEAHRDLDKATHLITDVIPWVTEGLKEGRSDAFTSARELDRQIEQLVRSNRKFLYLLKSRSVLRDAQGLFSQAFDDIKEFINSNTFVDAGALTQAGILTMTLGKFADSTRLLHLGRDRATDEAQRIKAEEFVLWNYSYVGQYDVVIARSPELLMRAEGLDKDLAMTIEHVWGRALLSKGLIAHDTELLEMALRLLRNAWRRADRFSIPQPFHVNIIYRAAKSLMHRDQDALFEEAIHEAERFGEGSWMGHVRVSAADRAMERKDWGTAVEQLKQASQIWMLRYYPKGIFDVSFRLGKIYRQMGKGYRLKAAIYSRLAARISTYLGLPELVDAHKQFFEILQALEFSGGDLIKRLDEKLIEEGLGRFLQPSRFSIKIQGEGMSGEESPIIKIQ